MKKKTVFLLLAAMTVSLLSACSSKSTETDAGSRTAAESSSTTEPEEVKAAEPSIHEVTLTEGSVTVYDYGDMKLHAYATGDALGDEAYIVEGVDGLVGIELPSFTAGLDAWKSYVEELKKPMDEIFLCAHAAGASYVEGMSIYGTQSAKDAIESGSTFATTQGLYETFGDDFHGGPDMAQINEVVPAGTVTAAGMEFNLIDRGDTYDLEIPALNVVYTHMLGKTSHSILAGIEHMDSMLAILKEYQEAEYDMILSAHCVPEGQDAVAEKIIYVEKAKELAESSFTAEEFISAMKEAFPDYTGDNYLEMSASYLYLASED